MVVPVLPCVTSFSSDNVFPKSKTLRPCERVQLSSLDHREAAEKSSNDEIWVEVNTIPSQKVRNRWPNSVCQLLIRF